MNKWIKLIMTVAPSTTSSLLDASGKAIDNASKRLKEKIEADYQESIRKLFEAPPGMGRLVVCKHEYTWKDWYDIYDTCDNIRYVVKGEFLTPKRSLHIYDSTGKELGKVKEKMFSMRYLFPFESHPKDFEIEIV